MAKKKKKTLAQIIREGSRNQSMLGPATGPGASSVNKQDKTPGPKPIDTRGAQLPRRRRRPKKTT
jgi:hypothetical protein